MAKYAEKLTQRFQDLYRNKYNREISAEEADVEISKLANLIKNIQKER